MVLFSIIERILGLATPLKMQLYQNVRKDRLIPIFLHTRGSALSSPEKTHHFPSYVGQKLYRPKKLKSGHHYWLIFKDLVIINYFAVLQFDLSLSLSIEMFLVDNCILARLLELSIELVFVHFFSKSSIDLKATWTYCLHQVQVGKLNRSFEQTKKQTSLSKQMTNSPMPYTPFPVNVFKESTWKHNYL